jgi:hypothetical protein
MKGIFNDFGFVHEKTMKINILKILIFLIRAKKILNRFDS